MFRCRTRGLHTRRSWQSQGVRKFTVVLSHWHLDHVAGTAAFADCEIIANRRTAAASRRADKVGDRGRHASRPAGDRRR